MLLRIFNDESPLVNTTQKRDAAIARELEELKEESEAYMRQDDAVDDALPSREEEQAIKEESLALGQEEQDKTNERETYGTADGEADIMNTTV